MVELIEQDFEKNKKIYNKVENDLKISLGETVKIDHVGSTAIPDIVGKNIIDVLVCANDSAEFEKFKDIICSEGYFASKNSASEIYQFFASRESETGDGDVHIHLVLKGTERYEEFLILKEYLLKNKKEAEDYSSFKKELILNGVTDRKIYREKKSRYVDNLIKRAKEKINNKYREE